MAAANLIPVKTAKVLGKVYKITDNAKANKRLEFDPKSDNGIHDSAAQRILIANVPIVTKQQVMLHELIHAIEDALSIKISHADLDRLATGLHTVFHDNPVLAAWLIGHTCATATPASTTGPASPSPTTAASA